MSAFVFHPRQANKSLLCEYPCFLPSSSGWTVNCCGVAGRPSHCDHRRYQRPCFEMPTPAVPRSPRRRFDPFVSSARERKRWRPRARGGWYGAGRQYHGRSGRRSKVETYRVLHTAFAAANVISTIAQYLKLILGLTPSLEQSTVHVR